MIKRLQHVETRRLLALLVLPVYVFLCVALFSGLHVHSRNGTCNFNGIEYQGNEPAQAYTLPLECNFLVWQEAVPESRVPVDGLPFHLSSRGPPEILAAL